MEDTLESEVKDNGQNPITVNVRSDHLYELVRNIFGELGKDYGHFQRNNPYFHGWDDRVPETRFGVPQGHPLHPCSLTLYRDNGTSRLTIQPKSPEVHYLIRGRLRELRDKR